MQLSTVGPASGAARAQLFLALLILALLPAALVSFPTRTDGLMFDIGPDPDPLAPGMTAEHSGWMLPWVRSTAYSRRFVVSDSLVLAPDPSQPRHRLVLEPNGRRLFDSRPIDSESLRSQLDLLMAGRPGWVDFVPEPNANYGDVIEIFASVQYAGFDRLRLDHSRYAAALDAGVPHIVRRRPTGRSGIAAALEPIGRRRPRPKASRLRFRAEVGSATRFPRRSPKRRSAGAAKSARSR